MKHLRFLIILVAFTAFTYPPKDIKLEYKFKVGDQFTWEQVAHQTIKQSIPGMGDVNVDVDISATMNLKIVEVKNGTAKIETFYEKMKMATKSSMGMGDMSMDSEGPQDNVQNKTVKAMMNKPYSFTLTALGVVERVEGTENLYSDFGSLGLDEATLATLKQQFQQSLGNDTQKSALSMAIITYPVNKLKAGDTWKTSTNGLAMNFATKVDNTTTLKSFDASSAATSTDGTITTVDKDKVVSLPNGIKSKLDVSGRQASTATIDVKTGWSSDTKTVSEIKGTMTLLAGGMIPSDMEVPIEIVSETQYKLTKK